MFWAPRGWCSAAKTWSCEYWMLSPRTNTEVLRASGVELWTGVAVGEKLVMRMGCSISLWGMLNKNCLERELVTVISAVGVSVNFATSTTSACADCL